MLVLFKFKLYNMLRDHFKGRDMKKWLFYLVNIHKGRNDLAVDKFKNTVHKAKGEVNWDDNTTKLKTNFKASGTVTWTSGNNVKVKVVKLANGTANVNGTAFADGSTGIAFKQGDWKTKKDVTALTGELGQELVVPPNGNRWYTVGDNGAEFAHIPRGSIVFNHKILWYCLVTSN